MKKETSLVVSEDNREDSEKLQSTEVRRNDQSIDGKLIDEVRLADQNLSNVEVIQKNHTLSKKSSSPSNDKFVQRVGKVWIRGMVRKIWRPRYLEIWNDGTVRYFEPLPSKCPESPSSSSFASFDPYPQNYQQSGKQLNQYPSQQVLPNMPLSIVPKHFDLQHDRDGVNSSLTSQEHISQLSLQELGQQRQQPFYHPHQTSPMTMTNEFCIGTSCSEFTGNSNWDVLPKSDIGTTSTVENTANQFENHPLERTNDSRLKLKATMTIHGTRLLEPNDRDAKIGLPKHAFGFLFHGKTMSLPHVKSSHMDLPLHAHHPFNPPSRDYMCAVLMEQEARDWLSALQWAAKQASNININKFGPTPITSPNINGNDNYTPEDAKEDGESLILEDYCNSHQNATCENVSSSDIHAAYEHERMKKVILEEDKQTSRANMNLPSSKVRSSMNSISENNRSYKSKRKKKASRGKSESKIVVTKVRKFSVQVIPFVDLAYEINMILIDGTLQEGREESRVDKNVEESTLYHSHSDFIHLISNLKEECSSKLTQSSKMNVGGKLSATRSTTFRILQKAETDLKNKIKSWDKFELISPWNGIALAEEGLLNNIDTLDKVLRLLTSDRIACNSKSMRDFLFPRSSRMSISYHDMCFIFFPNLWNSPQHRDKRQHALINDRDSEVVTNAIVERLQPKVEKRNIYFEDGESADDFMKKWLWSDPSNSIPMKVWIKYVIVLFCCKCQRLLYGIFSVVTISWFGIEFSKCGNDSFGQITVSMRISTLFLSFVTIFIFGFEMGQYYMRSKVASKSIQQKNSQNVDERRKKIAEARIEKENCSLTKSAANTIVEGRDVDIYNEDDGDDMTYSSRQSCLTSPLPHWPQNCGRSCWSEPRADLFKVRGKTYLQDKIKINSSTAIFPCRGVDVWLTANENDLPIENIARHPSVLGGRLHERKDDKMRDIDVEDTFIINFLLPFGNLVGYFSIKPVESLPENIAMVWTRFRNGDTKYRDARLKMLPMVIDGPWVVRKAVGPGSSPAVLGKAIPLKYFETKGAFEIDVVISSSRIAKAILNVVKGHTDVLTIAFAFIIEAVDEVELPEVVLCAFQIHELNLKLCPKLPSGADETKC